MYTTLSGVSVGEQGLKTCLLVLTNHCMIRPPLTRGDNKPPQGAVLHFDSRHQWTKIRCSCYQLNASEANHFNLRSQLCAVRDEMAPMKETFSALTADYYYLINIR